MLDNEKRDYFGEHSGANSLTWIETKRAYKDGKLGFYVDRGLALKAASSGLDTGFFGPLYGMAMPIVFIAGIAMAFFLAWWWFFVGVGLSVACFRLSRHAAVTAVRKSALRDENLFHVFRENKVIWFEKLVAK